MYEVVDSSSSDDESSAKNVSRKSSLRSANRINSLK